MGEAACNMEVAQPMELFDLGQLPVRNDLVEMVRDRSFLPARAAKHTGKIVIKQMLNDEELCEAVCTALLAGLSARLVGRRFQLSPKSVANIRDAMEERGELAPVRTRIQRKLDRVTELGLECVEDGLLSGEIHPGQAWIPALASVDKREQLSVGMVPGTERTRASVTTEQVLAEHALAMAGLKSPESESTGGKVQVVDIQATDGGTGQPATGPATGSKARTAPHGPTLDTTTTPATTPATTPKAGGGGRDSGPAHG